MWQEKCLKGEKTGKCKGRDALQAAKEVYFKVEGQGWRKEDKDLKERPKRDEHSQLQHILHMTHILDMFLGPHLLFK